MAYQQVGTPRFYINIAEWYLSTGAAVYGNIFNTESGTWGGIDNPNIFTTLPINPVEMGTTFGSDWVTVIFPIPIETYKDDEGIDKGFVAILGHEYVFGSSGHFEIYRSIDADGTSMSNDITPIVNASNAGMFTDPEHAGFTILKVYESTIRGIYFEPPVPKIGQIVIGSYYDMPHSPDLSVQMTREYGGTKSFETRGGSTLSNTMWSKPPDWGRLAAWELGTSGVSYPPQHLSRSGRRIWDLSFSYLDGGDVWGSNQMLSKIRMSHGVGLDSEDYDSLATHLYTYNILQDNNFFSQVFLKTNGGQIPFIFQPDNNDNNPHNFAICKLDQSSFQFEQVAKNLYNCNMKIREVW